MDRFKLWIPVFGTLLRKAAISRFARTLGMLVQSGVPILQSLDIMRGVIGNEVMGIVVGNVRQVVEKGEKMSETLKVSKEFPPDAVQMIAVGEETGNLDYMLNKIADFYDRSLGYTIKRLTTVIEPLLTCLRTQLCTLSSRAASSAPPRSFRSRNRWFTARISTTTWWRSLSETPRPYPVMLRTWLSTMARKHPARPA